MRQALHRLKPERRGVLQHLGHEVNGIDGSAMAEHFRPGQGLDLRELELGVVAVHGHDFFSCRGAQNFDDFDKLINARFAGEKRMSKHEFSHDTSGRPHIDSR